MLKWPQPLAGEPLDASIERVHGWAQGLFEWNEDFKIWGVREHWPLRSELEAKARHNAGKVLDDCDGYASLCRYALWDLGVANRILTCDVEPGAAPSNPHGDGNHAVCTPEGTGRVMDNRYSVVVTREELEQTGYRWRALSGLHPGDPWTEVKK